MGADKRSENELRESQWRWPRELESSASDEHRYEYRAISLPEGVMDNKGLRRTICDHPDDDLPRQAYAAWMRAQDHEFAQTIADFILAQLRVAEAFSANPRADVTTLRSWNGTPHFVSTAAFRAGDTLRPWYQGEVSELINLGYLGWPQVYRGCVERVAI